MVPAGSFVLRWTKLPRRECGVSSYGSVEMEFCYIKFERRKSFLLQKMDDDGAAITTLKILIIGESGVGKSRF